MEKNIGAESDLIDIDLREKRALLISPFRQNISREIAEEHLLELQLLSETCGIQVVDRVAVPLRRIDASTYVTSGKLRELQQLAQECAAELLIFDDEISPAQQRNLEKLLQLPVVDRTKVIIDVVAQRAHTKEARLQVALAQVKYQAPRLKRLWTHLSRQAGTAGAGGGGGYLKGEGEKQIEIDRRILKRKIERHQNEIAEVRAMRDTQRSARIKAGIPLFALVGYTNAGKSTLLNAMTGSDVFVEDKLFATLDTTTRKYLLENNQEVLLIDTVGFIRKLPHLLVAAFKSTLEEALHADILMHIIDASHHMALEQAEATCEVLKELGAENTPIITVLNKIDLLTEKRDLQRFRVRYPKTVEISALNNEGFEELQSLMAQELAKQRKLFVLRIPQSRYGVVSEAIELGNVLQQEYEGNDVLLRVELPLSKAKKFVSYVQD